MGRKDSRIIGGDGFPACCVISCGQSLAGCRVYNQRCYICPDHQRAKEVLQNGRYMRFCHQCGRLELLTAFSGNQRSCRVSLERKRKGEKRAAQEHPIEEQKLTAAPSQDGDFTTSHVTSAIERPITQSLTRSISCPSELLMRHIMDVDLSMQPGMDSGMPPFLTPQQGDMQDHVAAPWDDADPWQGDHLLQQQDYSKQGQLSQHNGSSWQPLGDLFPPKLQEGLPLEHCAQLQDQAQLRRLLMQQRPAMVQLPEQQHLQHLLKQDGQQEEAADGEAMLLDLGAEASMCNGTEQPSAEPQEQRQRPARAATATRAMQRLSVATPASGPSMQHSSSRRSGGSGHAGHPAATGFAAGSPVTASPASCIQQVQEEAGFDPFAALSPADLPLLEDLLQEATATHHNPATWPPLATPARAPPASSNMPRRGPPAGAAGHQVPLQAAGRAEDWQAMQPGEPDGLLMGTPDTELSQHYEQQCRSSPRLQRARSLPPPQPAASAGLELALPACTCQGRGRSCGHCFVKAVQQLSGRCFGCPLHELPADIRLVVIRDLMA